MALTVGDKVPSFNLPISNEKSFSSGDFLGKKCVIYFYPKDSTPGCTTEAENFRDLKEAFEAKNTKILGISKDSLKRHEKFQEKLGLNFFLASDEEDQVCEDFGVWVEKNMYGRKYMGIERSTFLVNEKGIIEKVWRKVRIKGHAEDVLKSLP